MATAQERWVSPKFELQGLSGEGLSVALLGLCDAIGTVVGFGATRSVEPTRSQ